MKQNILYVILILLVVVAGCHARHKLNKDHQIAIRSRCWAGDGPLSKYSLDTLDRKLNDLHKMILFVAFRQNGVNGARLKRGDTVGNGLETAYWDSLGRYEQDFYELNKRK